MKATLEKIVRSRRMWLHFPIGVANGIWLICFPWLGLGFLVGFLCYELDQCSFVQDGAYHDVLGHIVGIATAGTIAVILKVGGLL